MNRPSRASRSTMALTALCLLAMPLSATAKTVPDARRPGDSTLNVDADLGGALQDLDGDLQPAPRGALGLALTWEPFDRLALNAGYTTFANRWSAGARILIVDSERFRIGPTLGAMGFPAAGSLGVYPYLGVALAWWLNDTIGFDAHIPIVHLSQMGAEHALAARLLWPGGHIGTFPLNLGLLNLRFDESWRARLSLQGMGPFGPAVYADAHYQFADLPLELRAGLFGMVAVYGRLGLNAGITWRM